jgi:hypothetical protein
LPFELLDIGLFRTREAQLVRLSCPCALLPVARLQKRSFALHDVFDIAVKIKTPMPTLAPNARLL